MHSPNNNLSNMNISITTKNMAMVGLMTALICILAPFSLSIPISPVPISLATMAIYFAIVVLGMKLGSLSVTLYLLLGLAGLPVFSGFSGGAGKLFGPTGGYLIGYLFMAFICGFFIDHWRSNIPVTLLGMLLGTTVCYLFGTAWLAYQLSLPFYRALMLGVIPYIPGDLIKLTGSMLLGYHLRKRLVQASVL